MKQAFDQIIRLFNNLFLPVEYDPVWAGRLEGEEHGESVAVGQADTDSVSFVVATTFAVDVVDEEGVADEARHIDVDLLLALAPAELRDETTKAI